MSDHFKQILMVNSGVQDGDEKMIKLKPINSRFKRLIHDFGDIWIVVNGPTPMACFNGGMGVLCRPANNNIKFSNFKWEDMK